jgi:hypothetical protein
VKVLRIEPRGARQRPETDAAEVAGPPPVNLAFRQNSQAVDSNDARNRLIA